MTTGCPICDNTNYKIRYERVFNFADACVVQCESCGHIYTRLLKPVNTAELYNDEVYKVVENRGSVFDRILNREYNRVLKVLHHFSPSNRDILDFGCGKGKFGWLAAKQQWNVKCVETSTDRAEYARRIYQLTVNSDFYNSGRIFENLFDVITLFHVLEHLPHPGKLLLPLTRDNLTPDGLLLVEVPNFRSWQSSWAKEKWIHLDVPRHINHFTDRRLIDLMKTIGFKPVRTSYYSFHLGVLGMLDTILKMFGYKKNIIFELKNKKTPILLIQIALILPVALILERLAAWRKRGGIVRLYMKYE